MSIGVVAFSQAQAQEQLVLDLVDARRRENEALDQMCDTDVDEERDEPLMIKNLEAVQGDERDIILFSIGYGPDQNQKITMGPLNRDGGHHRLNVAITRARQQVIVFSSLRGEDLNPSRVKAQGVNDLKNHLSFAEKGARMLDEISLPAGQDYDSPLERQIAEAIRRAGFQVVPQVGVSSYRIDLGVVDKNAPGRYLCGVECDGAMYHSAATARERHRLRQYVLEDLGWNIVRVWSTDWWNNPQREIEKLLGHFQKLQGDADEERAKRDKAVAEDVGISV